MKGEKMPTTAQEETISYATKNTVATSLSDALQVIHESDTTGSDLSVDDFIIHMESRGVDFSAAQDTLLFLRGTGEYEIDNGGMVRTLS